MHGVYAQVVVLVSNLSPWLQRVHGVIKHSVIHLADALFLKDKEIFLRGIHMRLVRLILNFDLQCGDLSLL